MKIDKKKIELDIKNSKKSYRSYKVDMSFGELMNLYVNSEIFIPDYQRHFRWKIEQRTRFIESLILGIPIPSIFVAENDNGKWEVIDGMQRLSTFFSFFGNLNDIDNDNWVLKKGDIIESLKDLKFSDLPKSVQLNIKRRTCGVEVIQSDEEDYSTRYELFNRLNTGGTPLSEQEIRNVIYRKISKNFNEFLIEYSDNSDFNELIPITQEKKDAMFVEELVLRFCSLYKDVESNMKGVLSAYMDKFMLKIVKETKGDENQQILGEYSEILDRTIKVLKPLGNDIFKSKSNKFSTSYYDGIMIGVSKNIDFYEKNPEKLEKNIRKLKSSKEFETYTGSAAQNRRNVIFRLREAKNIFADDG